MMVLPAFALPFAIGFGLVRALSGGGRRLCRHDVWRALLGAGLGVGISSCCFFLGLLAGWPAWLFEVALFAAVLAGCAFRWRSARCPFCDSAEHRPAPKWLALVFGLAAGAGIALFLWISLRSPHGGWDAWSIWNLRARFLLRAGAHWRDAFSPALGWSHPDYPLLVPGFVARCWRWMGSETVAVPIALALLFAAATVGLLVSSAHLLRGPRHAWVAGLFLIGTPFFITEAAAQYADVPLSFYLLASVALLTFQERRPEQSGFAILAGLAAGLGCWTKNEGQWITLALLAAWLAVSRARRLPQLLRFFAGLLPPLAVELIFKLTLAPANPLWNGPVAARILDPWRYLAVISALIAHLWSFGGLFAGPVLFLATYLLLAGIGIQPPARAGVKLAAITVGLTLMGYSAVYVMSSYDLSWLLETSLDRLLLHVWPATIFGVVLAVQGAKAPQPQQPARAAKASKRR